MRKYCNCNEGDDENAHIVILDVELHLAISVTPHVRRVNQVVKLLYLIVVLFSLGIWRAWGRLSPGFLFRSISRRLQSPWRTSRRYQSTAAVSHHYRPLNKPCQESIP